MMTISMMMIINDLEMKMASCVLHVFIGTPCNHSNDNDDNNDNNTSQTDVAPWCYKCTDGLDGNIWVGWLRYGAPSSAHNNGELWQLIDTAIELQYIWQ